MKYDDASWHYGGNFPSDLSDSAGATHTGMFLAWAFLSGLAGEDIVDGMPDAIAPLQNRTITPGEFFLTQWDGKFIDDDLNDLGNEFAKSYFDFESGDYLTDYESTVGANYTSLYYVPDTWETYDALKLVLDERFRQWSAKRSQT